MRLSNREKLLVVFLLIAGIGFVTFTYVINPQWKVINELRVQQAELETQLERIRNSEQTESDLDAQIELQYLNISESAKQYYNTTPQEELILLFNDLFDVSSVRAESMSFPAPEVVPVGTINFMKTNVDVSFTGTYDSMMKLLDTVWAFPKEMQVKNITMVQSDGMAMIADTDTEAEEEVAASTESPGITGTVTFELYNMMMDTGMVDNLYTWYTDEIFNKSTPFTPYTKATGAARYIYTGDGANLFNFDRFEEFTDINGHWLEAEINEFLKSGFIFMNPYNTFEPNKPVTRGDFIVLLDNVYQWQPSGEEVDLTLFTDYAALGDMQSSYAKAIQKGFLSGFLEGYDDKTLKPADPINYEEVELIMRRIKRDDGFVWSDVSADIADKKGVFSETWSDQKATMTKAEAVYLLTYFK